MFKISRSKPKLTNRYNLFSCHSLLTNLPPRFDATDSYELSMTQADTGQLTGVSTDPEFRFDEQPGEEAAEDDAEMDKAKNALLKAALKRREAKKKEREAPRPQQSDQGTSGLFAVR